MRCRASAFLVTRSPMGFFLAVLPALLVSAPAFSNDLVFMRSNSAYGGRPTIRPRGSQITYWITEDRTLDHLMLHHLGAYRFFRERHLWPGNKMTFYDLACGPGTIPCTLRSALPVPHTRAFGLDVAIDPMVHAGLLRREPFLLNVDLANPLEMRRVAETLGLGHRASSTYGPFSYSESPRLLGQMLDNIHGLLESDAQLLLTPVPDLQEAIALAHRRGFAVREGYALDSRIVVVSPRLRSSVHLGAMEADLRHLMKITGGHGAGAAGFRRDSYLLLEKLSRAEMAAYLKGGLKVLKILR